MTNIFKQLYIRSAGYSYTNLGRMFLRLFVGVMLMQFGLRQWVHFDEELILFPTILGISPEILMPIMIIIEILCSLCIMVGFCTRLMVVPPFLAMLIAECYLLSDTYMASYLISWSQPAYLPMMFMGIYFFIFLVGPGKISVDYFLSLHFIHTDNQSETELEEV